MLSTAWHLGSNTTGNPSSQSALSTTGYLLLSKTLLVTAINRRKQKEMALWDKPTLCILSQFGVWPLWPLHPHPDLSPPHIQEASMPTAFHPFLWHTPRLLALRTPFSLRVARSWLSPAAWCVPTMSPLLTSSTACVNHKPRLQSSTLVWLPYRAASSQTTAHISFLLESLGHTKICLDEMLPSQNSMCFMLTSSEQIIHLCPCHSYLFCQNNSRYLPCSKDSIPKT